MKTRHHVIMSHGGRHGSYAKTYLRGSKISAKASEHVPNRLLASDTKEPAGSDASLKKAPAVRGKEGQSIEKAPAAKAAPKAERVKTPAGKEVTDIKPPETPPEKAATPESVDLPTTKRELTLMKKEDLIALADSLGLDSSGTGTVLRERLGEELGL